HLQHRPAMSLSAQRVVDPHRADIERVHEHPPDDAADHRAVVGAYRDLHRNRIRCRHGAHIVGRQPGVDRLRDVVAGIERDPQPFSSDTWISSLPVLPPVNSMSSELSAFSMPLTIVVSYLILPCATHGPISAMNSPKRGRKSMTMKPSIRARFI